jgi:nucleoside-diphosphate-sugar epimerase
MSPSSAQTDVDVLITGASGFVGRALLQELRRRGPVRAVGIGRGDVDLADEAQVRAAFEASRPRKVVHLASALPAGGPDDWDRQWRDTFLAGRNVVEVAGEVGVQQLLLAGSVAELGDQGGVLAPDLPCRPHSHYGLCKALVLEVAGFVARREPMRIDWFRPFTVYGPGQVGSMLVPAAFSAAADEKPADFTDGSQERDFLFIDDLVGWIAAGVAWPVPQDVSGHLGIHHLGTGVATPVRSVLEHIAALFPQAQFRLGALPRRPGEPSCQVALRSDAPWPWAPKISLDEGLAATASWWRSRRGAKPASL